jgi:VanZ family protein
MKILYHFVRKYPITCILIAAIWYLCFCTPPHTSLDNVAFIDKWVHSAMYLCTCSVMWIEYIRRHKKVVWNKALIFAWIAPIVMSGLIEILQATCTGGRRSGEWLDFVANTTGATLAAVICILAARYCAKRRMASDEDGNCKNGDRQ